MEMTTSFSLKRSLRLLYWAFFKPFTLHEFLKSRDSHSRPPRKRNTSKAKHSARSEPSLAFRPVTVDALLSLCLGIIILVPVGVLLGSQLRMVLKGDQLSTVEFIKSILVAIMSGLIFGGTTIIVFSDTATGLAVGVARSVVYGLVYSMMSNGTGILSSAVETMAFAPTLGVITGATISIMIGATPANVVIFGIGGVLGVVSGLLTHSVVLGVVSGLAFVSCHYQLYKYVLELPFNLSLSVLAYLFPKHAILLYHLSPVNWDELIWLPLPFLDQQLALVAEQDNETGLKEITNVAASLRQGWAAEAALVELNARTMKRAMSLDDIVRLPKENWWLGRWQKLPLLGILADRTGSFFEALHRALNATTNLNRWKRLKTANEALADIRLSMGSAPRKIAVSFGPVFEKWRNILVIEIEHLERELGPQNPFIAGNPIGAEDSRLFTGRDDVFHEIEATLLATGPKPTLVLYGPRRSGKTSLLLQLPRRLEEDVIPIHVDMQGATQVKGLSGVLFNIADRTVRGAASGRGVELPMPTLEDFSVEPVIAFNRWLDQAEAKLDNRVLFLALDEFEKIQQAIDKGILDTSILDMLRNLIQFRRKLVLLFAGVSTLEEMGHDWHSYFISVRPIRVGYLKPEDVRQLVTKPTDDFGLEYEGDAIERILTATRCQPYLVQLTCFELVTFLNSRERRTQGAWDCAKLADVEQAIQCALRSGEPYFANVWSDSSPVEQRILIALAAGTPFEADREALNHLQRRDLIEPVEGGGWRFQVEMIREWVRREKT